MSAGSVIYHFALMFLGTSFIFIIASMFVAEFIDLVNVQIADGMTTTIFVQYFNFVRSIFVAIPLISITAAIIWAIVRIQEEKQQGSDF